MIFHGKIHKKSSINGGISDGTKVLVPAQTPLENHGVIPSEPCRRQDIGPMGTATLVLFGGISAARELEDGTIFRIFWENEFGIKTGLCIQMRTHSWMFFHDQT